MAKELIEQEIHEIAYSKLSNINTAIKYDTSKWTVEKIKKEFGTNVGKGKGVRYSGFKLTDKQKSEIAESNLDKEELSLIYGVHYSTINKVRRSAGKSKPKGGFDNRIEVTDHQLERIKDVTISAKKLTKEIGVSAYLINTRRRELGISFEYQIKPKVEKPKLKQGAKPKLTDEQIKQVELSKLSTIRLSEIYNCSASLIAKIRQKAGISIRFKREPSEKVKEVINSKLTNVELSRKLKVSTSRISNIRSANGIQREKSPKGTRKPPKPYVAKQQLPQIMKKKLSPMDKNQFEIENESKAKAVKAKQSFDTIMEKQKEAGYKWWLINDRGITARKWSNVKPINAI